MTKDLEVKTALSEADYRAMLQVIEAKGMTQAGYIRHLILRDVCDSQSLVSLMSEIRGRAESGMKPAPVRDINSPVAG